MKSKNRDSGLLTEGDEKKECPHLSKVVHLSNAEPKLTVHP